MIPVIILILLTASTKVIKANGADVDTYIKSNDIIMVRFCMSWSLECNFTREDYEYTSNHSSLIKFLEVEVMNDPATIKKYDLFNYPAVMLFIKEKKFIYKGESCTEEMLSFIEKSKYPLVHPISNANMIINDGLATLIIVDKSGMQLDGISERFNNVHFYLSTAPMSYHEKTIPQSSMLLIRRGEVYTQSITNGTDTIELFLMDHLLDTINEFNRNFGDYMLKRHHNVTFLFYNHEKQDYALIETFIAAAKLRKEMIFSISTRKNPVADSFLGFLDINDDSLPKVVIVMPTQKRTASYRLNKEITTENILTFIDEWKEGKVKKYMKSDPIPDTQESKYVKRIVSLNFDEEVLQANEDVMVKYFAPGCSHCIHLKPIYEQLARKVTNAGNKIKFVEIDATGNEIDGTLIASYPTIHYYKANKSEHLVYRMYREEAPMIEFLKQYSTEKFIDVPEDTTEVKTSL